MDFKTVLVELGDDAGCADRIHAAADLARRFSGHVVGLTATGFRLEPFRSVGEESLRYAELAQQALVRRAEEASGRFARVMANAGSGISHSHRLVEEETGWALATAGRVADIVVVRQPAEPSPTPLFAADPAEFALLNAGRPLLVVPAGVGTVPARHVAIAWDGRREAARAVADAMPLLLRASDVTVVAVPRPELQEEGTAVEAVLEYLRRHGIVAAARMQPDKPDAGLALLDAVADIGADLLVAGGYGHSRMREMAMGGVTRTLMRFARGAVLMSH